MAKEEIRGCGYRKVDAMYLVGSGIARGCDIIPIKLTPCPTCGFEIPFTRAFMWISKKYIMQHAIAHQDCSCPKDCPLCYPNMNNQTKYGLMWVGQKFYSPKTFIDEAVKMGVSKRIGVIPKDLVLGETWVVLAHRKVPFYETKTGLASKEPSTYPAIFYAFVPQRIEMLIWKSQATLEKLAELRKQGITAIVISDGDKDHA